MLSIKTTKALAVWYVPEFRGNRESAPEAQFAVKIEPMTVAEANAAQDARLRKVKAGANLAGVARGIRDEAIKGHVVDVEGIAEDGKEPLRSGEDLIALISKANDASLDALLDEIFEAISSQSKLSEGERKN